MSTPPPHDRRHHPRLTDSRRGVVVAEGREWPCTIIDTSEGGARIRLDRAVTLSNTLTLVDVDQAISFDARVAWQKGVEAGLKLGPLASVRGLVPSRLLPAREAWVRASKR